MALKKILPTRFGHDAEYHKVESVHLNFVENFAEVILLSFENKKTRDAGYRYLDSRRILLKAIGFNDDDPRKAAYKLIKKQELFTDSEDVIEH